MLRAGLRSGYARLGIPYLTNDEATSAAFAAISSISILVDGTKRRLFDSGRAQLV